MALASLRITEHDDAGNVTATYVHSPGEEGKRQSRIDVIPPVDPKSLWQKGLDVFLPVGYPSSVTHDYLEYQIYDSLQAFSSSIASLLSSRAVLSSVGVGDSSASPTSALLLSIFQESVGRLATILFAHRFGTAIEPECKMYRLLADILNDTGFLLDILSPIFPKPIRVIILSFSSVLRSLCGVAAGSAKASLSAHFATRDNLGELNAKDSSQETVISLLGMWAGSLVVMWITTPQATWTAMVLLLAVHLEMNRRAVRAVSLRTLNRQRATLVYHHLCKGKVPTPVEVSRDEKIFERDGVLRTADGSIGGHCTIGAPFSQLLHLLSTSSSARSDHKLETLISRYASSPYILWHTPGRAVIILKKDITPRTLLVAWWEALSLQELQTSDAKDMAETLMAKYAAELEAKGWDLDSNALETRAGTRVEVET